MGQRTGNTKPVDELEGRLNPLLEGIARAECVWVARPVEMSPWLRLSRRSLLAGGLHESAQRIFGFPFPRRLVCLDTETASLGGRYCSGGKRWKRGGM
jgi:hypothetical protein